jgi:bifunctional DNA-binding transcriptional regulator/antitoxin component of YhaV-PrlF toxin-antitoxin module
VTSKLQVTIPKAIAQRYGIEPGTDIEWLPAGEAIRVVPAANPERAPDRGRRLDLFDRATERQGRRQAGREPAAPGAGRGWRREDVYVRAGAG